MTDKKSNLHAPAVMNKVDILDRIHILVMQVTPGHFQVDFECLEPGMQLVFDPKALDTLRQKINDVAIGKNARDPNTRGYIEEFVGRLVQAYKQNNLVDIVPYEKEIDDHYAKMRKN